MLLMPFKALCVTDAIEIINETEKLATKIW